MSHSIKIRRPDDMHVHLREGGMLQLVAPLTAKDFARALVMPNTNTPILSGWDVAKYRGEIKLAAPGFEPLMTIKLVESTTPEIILAAQAAGAIAAKVYPQGVTTNSADGIDPEAVMDTYEALEACGMVLCLHGEMPGVFCMDREAAFLTSLETIAGIFPKLKIVLEHVTTAAAVRCVERLGPNVAATITVHHLMLTLDDVVGDKIQPHNFCKPIAKTPADRAALREAATSGNPKFFLGTDSAPHSRYHKECASGCAGVFTAPVAMPLLAEIFETEGSLGDGPVLERFTSEFGARFYGLPLNEGTLTLVRKPWTSHREYQIPSNEMDSARDRVRPFLPGREMPWQTSL